MSGKKSQEIVLSLESVSLHLNDVMIFKDINLSLNSGCLHALVGPNGAGKSSLMRCILGEMPHRGQIKVASNCRGKIAYVPQQLSLDLELPMRVIDFFSIFSRQQPIFWRTKRKNDEAIRNLLCETGAEHLLEKSLPKLSGGEQRRVLLAHALSHKPRILLLDEPASQVDADGTNLIHRLVRKLADNGITVLMISHNIEACTNIADRISVLNNYTISSADPGILAGTSILPTKTKIKSIQLRSANTT